MLSKLLKYEIKATARILLPLYAALLIFAAINKLISVMFPGRLAIPEAISMIVYVMILIGIVVMTIVIIIQRFYKNLLSDEGYLMFTLPAKTWQHIISKLLISMMWTVVSGFAALLSICIITIDRIIKENVIQLIFNGIFDFFDYFGASSVLIIIEALLLIIIGLASYILIVYASMALGHLANKHRILLSLGAFVAINTATQIIASTIGVIASAIPFFRNLQTDFNEPYFHLLAWMVIIFAAILISGYFVITNLILSKRLNLD